MADVIEQKKPKKKSGKTKAGPDGKVTEAVPACLKFLKSAHVAVREHLTASTDLPTFLASAGDLSLEDRKRIVRQALLLIDDNFVHLPLKRAMHGVDPVQKLKLIQHRLDRPEDNSMGGEFAFHRDMIEVFTSVRDLHTNYLLPVPFADKIAFLPFDVEEYFDDQDRQHHYIASHFVPGFSHASFKPGVEITTWNGVPIQRAIAVSADQHAGSNEAARHARGVDGLTLRALRRSLPPDAMWVVIGYIDLQGTRHEMRQDWIVTPMLPENTGVNADSATLSAACLGLDIDADIKQHARKMLFAPRIVDREKRAETPPSVPAATDSAIPTAMPGVFSAKSRSTDFGEFGHIRIFTFNVQDPGAFIDEFIRLAELLPQEGLILDVRGNGGGHIHASEGLLQVLTPGEITPEPTQFINTPLNRRICERHESNPVGIDLGPWADSIRDSVETGAIYSRGFPITSPEFANAIGQRYHGPVVLITDARCYSATDIFAAGFKDHGIGKILGVDSNTGAGGANVWTHDLLSALLQFPQPADPETPYHALPNGAGMRVAIRRTLRVGEDSGTPLEDLGVKPDFNYKMTKDDLTKRNKDLINAAGEILADMRVRRLNVSVTPDAAKIKVEVTSHGLSRLDAYIDGRPVGSKDVQAGQVSFDLSPPASAEVLELKGYDNGELVAARKIAL